MPNSKKSSQQPDHLKDHPITQATIEPIKGILKQEPEAKPVTQMLLEGRAEEPVNEKAEI